MEYISDVIATIALLVSGYAIYQSHGINKRQKPLIESQEKINQILLEKDKLDNEVARKAVISAEYVLGGSNDCLKIWNSGLSTARNVEIHPQEDVAHPLIEQDVLSKFPLESLTVGQDVKLISAIHDQTSRKHNIRFIWDDEFKDGNEIVLSLTI